MYIGRYRSIIAKKPIRRGDKGKHVLHLQKELNCVVTPKLKLTGECDEETELAIIAIQKESGLIIDRLYGLASHKAVLELMATCKIENKRLSYIDMVYYRNMED